MNSFVVASTYVPILAFPNSIRKNVSKKILLKDVDLLIVDT